MLRFDVEESVSAPDNFYPSPKRHALTDMVHAGRVFISPLLVFERFSIGGAAFIIFFIFYELMSTFCRRCVKQ